MKVIKCIIEYYYIPRKEDYEGLDVSNIEDVLEFEDNEMGLFDETVSHGNFSSEIVEVDDETFNEINIGKFNLERIFFK